MEWSFIPDREFTAQSRHDNAWTGTRSQLVGKISVAFPPEDWFCWKFEQMNLYIIDGHVSRSGERGWLRTDQSLKVPKTQNRWYGLHPALNPVDIHPGKVVKFWSNSFGRNHNRGRGRGASSGGRNPKAFKGNNK